MYLGSVRFFRHLILALFVCAFVCLAVGTGILASHAKELRLENAGLLEVQSQLSQELDGLLTLQTQQEAQAREAAALAAVKAAEAPSLDYQALYPELYADAPEERSSPENTVYLTFDDGPSQSTDEILEILDRYGVKAAFFVIGKDTPEGRARLQRIAAAGHTIGIHTYSHKYNEVYQSVEAYLADFDRAYQWVYETTGVKPTIFRFPGGSVNGYNQGIYQQLIAEMLRRGFTYYDWNISGEDTVGSPTAASVRRSVLDSVSGYRTGLVLLHDGPRATVNALDEVIEGIRDKGYALEALTPEVKPIVFSYPD